MKQFKILFVIFAMALLLRPFQAAADNYFVSSTTGVDSSSCGFTAADSCKTIGRTYQNAKSFSPQEPAVIQIAQGTYLESAITHQPLLQEKHNVTFEGGWSPDFSSHRCTMEGTVVIMPKPTAQFDHIFLAQTSDGKAVDMTVRCMTLMGPFDPAGADQLRAIYAISQQGDIVLHVEHVQMKAFKDSVVDLHVDQASTLTAVIEQNIIESNKDCSGINLWVNTAAFASLSVVKNILRGNEGGIYLHNYHELTATVENNLIYDNIGSKRPGFSSISYGAGAVSTVKLVNNTITGNTYSGNSSIYSGGIFVEAVNNSETRFTMINTILWGNHGEDSDDLRISENSSTLNFRADYTILGDFMISGSPAYSSTHEQNISPRIGTDGHLLSGSPAIDSGVCAYTLVYPFSLYLRQAPADDIDGDMRPVYPATLGCDIGADEYHFPWVLFRAALLH